ncbi:MAG: dTDP-4-dehydrorhamnose 3,5-epimerase [Rhodospirillaceae bacterium]
MDITHLAIPEILILKPVKHGDERGFFSETYNQKTMAEAGISLEFVQDNHAYSPRSGTVRGLHFQIPPRAQTKLIRVVRGAIYDVALDLRRGSPTYGQHVSAVISAREWNQILIPAGFAHGLCTLEPDTEVIYKVTDHYAPNCDRGVLWNDPALSIEWPVDSAGALVSQRDSRHPNLADLPPCFEM